MATTASRPDPERRGVADEGETETETERIDLAECGLVPSCDPWFDHGFDVSPVESLECAAELVIDRQPGLLQYTANSGEVTFSEYVLVLLGDDAVIRQVRLTNGGASDRPVLELHEQELCMVAPNPHLAHGCQGPDASPCTWTGDVVDCTPVTPQSCEEITHALAG